MAWRSLLLPLFLLGALTGASCTSSSAAAGSSCASARGQCVLGGTRCSKQAATSAQDCNPAPENPGGGYCCLELADDASTGPSDAGGRDALADVEASKTPPPSSCPAEAPTAGASCTSTGIACGYVDPSPSVGAYGSSVCAIECTYGDDVRYSCRPDFACIGGHWTSENAMAAGPYPCTSPPPESCPSGLDATANDDCSVVGAVCAYGSSACVCTACTGGCPETADGGVPVTWQCDAPPTTKGCTAAAPNYGTACSESDLTCTYGNCFAGTWMEAKCVEGVWRRTNDACAI